MPVEYVHLRLSFDASCPQKSELAQLALHASACPKEPGVEACLIGSCDGGVISSVAGSGIRLFDSEAV